MRQRGALTIGLLLLTSAAIRLTACGGDPVQLGDGGLVDAATSDQQAPTFTLSLVPGHLTEDIGDTNPVGIAVHRSIGFMDTVTFAVTVPSGLSVDTTTPLPLFQGSTFQVTAVSVPSSGPDVTLTVTGTSGSTVQTATLGVRIGSRLMPDDAGVVVVPPFVPALSTLTVKAWGAGGGGGADCIYNGSSTIQGGVGGGGGYADAYLTIYPGEAFRVVAGTGGTGIATVGNGGGAGGGGYSAFYASDGGLMLMAGGGGGGTAATCQGLSYNYGSAGGGGGGGSGELAVPSGQGGGLDAGGAGGGNGSAGSAFLGGAGGGTGTPIAGGTPGGGAGNSLGGAGGGGGYFGGGGGGSNSLGAGAGGGGSTVDLAYALGIISANDAVAANYTDPDRGDGGAAMGGGGAYGINGGPGLVVVKLPKP